MTSLKGIHHVTAITGDAQRNVDFYCGVLGLRLVKKTVNFDDPNSYHLYYGDRTGAPGTLLTFFAWPESARGIRGVGEPVALAFSIPPGSIGSWTQRLRHLGFTPAKTGTRFGAAYLTVADPDDTQVELIESAHAKSGEAIGGIHSITLAMADQTRSAALYTNELNFATVGDEEVRARFAVGEGEDQSFVDVVTARGGRGAMGAGTIHHVAFRTPDDASQAAWLGKLTRLHLHVSPVMDRTYFHSIYFRERAGVLFEIATDGPGMAVDEPKEHLGEALMLPAEYEKWRSRLEVSLPPLVTPQPFAAKWEAGF